MAKVEFLKRLAGIRSLGSGAIKSIAGRTATHKIEKKTKSAASLDGPIPSGGPET